MNNLFGGIYKGKKVFLTGHSGFKGSWLYLWLQQMGAIVKGYSLKPVEYLLSHAALLNQVDVNSIGDIRDESSLNEAIQSFNPDIIFHLAAQPLVRKSYVNPIETFDTNILGTVQVLNAARKTSSIKVIVNITTDKVYYNRFVENGYCENDALGGHDPYSTSKACVELVHESFRNSFFKDLGILSATARAGNVIGGGDWAEDRLIPDIIKCASKKNPVSIRNPESVRPWQHVLDPLSGYLLLGQRLLEGKIEIEGAWNFGPRIEDCISVKSVLTEFSKSWKGLQWNDDSNIKHPHESAKLTLNCEKAYNELHWVPVWNIYQAISKTADWYMGYYESNLRIDSLKNLQDYIADAKRLNLIWAI